MKMHESPQNTQTDKTDQIYKYLELERVLTSIDCSGQRSLVCLNKKLFWHYLNSDILDKFLY